MRISNNPASIAVYKGVRQAADSLYSSMKRLSSGERLSRPGDAPADYGISEMLRYQIRNGAEAKRNIENARNMISTADSWMQATSNILTRMSELAISASDSSKSPQDRANLEEEYLQLKAEISRVARQSKYNGLQVAGRDQMITYDQDLKTFVFAQLDGSESYRMPVKVLSGLQSQNNQDFLFDGTGEFTQSYDGSYVFYTDTNNNLVKYDIENGTLFRDAADTAEKGIDVDETGRLWAAAETAPGSGIYQLKQQNVTEWTQESTLVADGDIADMSSKEFRVYQDRVYYVNTAGDLVSRGLSAHHDVKVEYSATIDGAFNTTEGQFAISQDGLFMADMPAAGVVRVINMESKLSQSFALPSNLTVDKLQFSADGQELMYLDTQENAIHRIEMLADAQPQLYQDHKVKSPSGATGFVGLNIDGGSHRAHFRVHNGPDAVQESFVTTGDVRLITLGISRTHIDTVEEAGVALDRVQKAIDLVSVQRAKLGAEAARIDQTYDALARYNDNIEQAESLISDTDIVKESANMIELQVRHQAALAIMAQANQQPSTVLRLLQQ